MSNQRIIFQSSTGVAGVVIPAPGFTAAQCMGAVPADAASVEVVDVADIPSDRTFRDAWFHDTTPAPRKIGVGLVKAKEISHERRRAKRAKEFAPLDVEATIPGKAAAAEAARAAVRAKYDAIQVELDACVDADALKAVLVREGL